MMRLLCNGVALDLYDNAGVQFTHKNPLFAFDSVECERTTQFKLPATPTNDQVLAVARVPAYVGTGMRVKFTAELQMSAVVKKGYLYVTAYDGKDYNAVFVTGEFVGLQAIKSLGKLKDILSYTETRALNGTPVTPTTTLIWSCVGYKKAADLLLHPSILLRRLYEDVVSQQGLTAQPVPPNMQWVRIIPSEIKGIEEQSVEFYGTMHAMANDGSHPICYNSALGSLDYMFNIQTARVARRVGNSSPYTMWTGSIQQFQCLQKTTIKFPTDWDDDYFIGYFLDGDTYLLTEFSFYGNRSFDENGVVTGDSLQGRSVEIPTGGLFTIISKNDYVNQMTSSGLDFGWGIQSKTCTFGISGTADTTGDMVRLQDNLPDMTFTELLKVIAGMSGRVLNYSEAEGITFDTLYTPDWPVVELKNLTKRGEVKRTFSNYAQSNIVHFSDDEGDKEQTEYTIDNDNIDEQKDLQKLPFTEGWAQGDLLYVQKYDKSPIVGVGGVSGTMLRFNLPKNAGIQSLCDASTQFKVEARMSLYEYEKISAKTILLVEGTKYVWTERSWQKDTATFTLARVLVQFPSDQYTRLQYIEHDGTALPRIDTGYPYDSSLNKYQAYFKFAIPTFAANKYAGLFGAYRADANDTIRVITGSATYRLYGYYNNKAANALYSVGSSYNITTACEIFLDSTKMTVNGTSISQNTRVAGTALSGYNFIIMDIFRGQNASGKMPMKVWSFKLYDNGYCVRDMIPCKRISDDVVGMFDMVEGKFYANAGTGTLTAGPAA